MHHLNRIAFKDLVIGLPKLKFERNKLCGACQMGSKLKALLNRLMLFQQLDHLGCCTWIYSISLEL